MKIGIVFGCFIPLHIGHKYLIDQAIQNNDKVIIGVCGYDNDRGKDFIPFKDRIALMKKIYSNPNITVVPIDDKKLGLDGSFSYNNWILWGNELFNNAKFNPNDLDNQYTWYMGEPSYTEKLSAIYKCHKYMTFDRNVISISGTKIRQNLNDNLKYVDNEFIQYLKMNRKSI